MDKLWDFPFFLTKSSKLHLSLLSVIISTGQYMYHQSFTSLLFKKLLKNSFHSIKIELRDSTGEKIPFVSSLLYFSRTCKTAWKRFWSSYTNSWENRNPLH